MIHDPYDENCPLNKAVIFNKPYCTCPPAVDEVDQIRERHERSTACISVGAMISDSGHDRATLLRIVDQLRAELAAFASLTAPSTEAAAVYAMTLKNNPHADMRAVPSQWVLNERAISYDVGEANIRLEAELAAAQHDLDVALFELSKAWKSLEDAANRIDELREDADDLRSDLAAAQSELERVRGWIKNTNCSIDCTYWDSDDDECSCGRKLALQEPTK